MKNLLNERRRRFNESLQEFYKKITQEYDHSSTSSLPSLMEVELNIEDQSPKGQNTPSVKKEEELVGPEVPKNNEVLGQNKKLITPNDFKKPSIRISYADAALHQQDWTVSLNYRMKENKNGLMIINTVGMICMQEILQNLSKWE